MIACRTSAGNLLMCCVNMHALLIVFIAKNTSGERVDRPRT
jgi:hypothetical protein